MASSRKVTNIFDLLGDEQEELTIKSSELPHYEQESKSAGKEQDLSVVDEESKDELKDEWKDEWKDSSKRKKKKNSKKPANTDVIVKTAKIASVYHLFDCPPGISDFDILERLDKLKIDVVDERRIVQDRYLVYGTKIRAMEFFYKLKELGYEGVVMAAAAYAPSQITTAWMCAQAGLNFHIFISGAKNRLVTTYTEKALDLGATMNSGENVCFNFRHYPRLKEAEAALDVWKLQKDKREWYHLATGCADEVLMNAIVNNMLVLKEKYDLKTSEFWVVGITGLIAACLAQAFPESIVHCVSLSDSIWPDLFKTKNYRIHYYPRNLGGVTTEYPFEVPFETTPNFGAKVMFFEKNMAPDAIIWNVY